MADAMDQIAAVKEGHSKNKSEKPRIALFSGHDTTVMPVLTTLIGDQMTRWPGYLSNVVSLSSLSISLFRLQRSELTNSELYVSSIPPKYHLLTSQVTAWVYLPLT